MIGLSNTEVEFQQQIARMFRQSKPEIILLYFLLRRNGKSYNEIKSEISLQDIGDENMRNALAFLQDDLEKVDEEIFDQLELVHRKFLEKQPLDYQKTMIENLILHVSSSNSHDLASYSLPIPLADFLLGFLDIKAKSLIYNPFAGLATFGILAEKGIYLGQEIVEKTWILGVLRLINSGLDLVLLELGNSTRKWIDFIGDDDIIVANPPYNARLQQPLETEYGIIRTFEEFVLYKSTVNLQENQQVLLLVPSNFISAKSHFLTRYRKVLVQSGLMSTIIQFPSGILSSTGLNLCALVLKRGEHLIPQVKMIDLTQILILKKRSGLTELQAISKKIESKTEKSWIRDVSIEEIEKNDFDLNVFRYWIPKIDGIPLSNILDSENASGIVSEPVAHYRLVPIVKIRDLLNDPVNYILQTDKLARVMEPKNGRYVTESCLLLSMRFNNLKPTWLKVEGTPVFVSSDIKSFSIDREKIYLPYLIQELLSLKVKEQVKGLSSTGTIPRLSLKDLKRIKIALPELEEQKEKVARTLKNIIHEEERRIANLRRDFEIDQADELSYLRHSLAGSVKKSRDAIEDLEKIIYELAIETPDILLAKAEKNTTLPLHTYLEILRRELENARLVLSRASLDIDLGKMKLEEVLLVDLLEKYTQELQHLKREDYNVRFTYDQLVIDKKLRRQLYIKVDQALLKRVFDNIVENAERHGFSGIPLEERELRIELLYREGDEEVQVDFSNTGNPLPEDYSHGNFIRKGSRTGKQAGNGYGGHLINTILHVFKGRIGFTDETGPEGIEGKYITTFEVYLPPNIKL